MLESLMVKDAGPDELEKEVGGEYNTLRVYMWLIRTETATAREASRALGFSSPSLGYLHLEKLVRLGLAGKDREGYHVLEKKRLGVLRFFFLIGRWYVPRTLFYTLFFASMTGVFLVLSYGNQYYMVATFVAFISSLLNLWETISFYRFVS